MLVGEEIVKRYRTFVALDGVSVSVERGGVTVVMGPSGAGKSTLVRALAQLEPPTSGRVALDGEELFPGQGLAAERCWPLVTVVFQQLFLWPHKTLLDNLTLPAALRGRSLRRLDELAEEFGITQHLGNYPNQVSIGQRQRAAIARALLLEPEFILMDEITAALDVEQIGVLLRVIAQQARAGTGILLVTHHLGFARKLLEVAGGRVVFLDRGRVVESGAPGVLSDPQSERVANFLGALEILS